MSVVPAKPSASVLIVRELNERLEVLLVRRNSKITFHGGAWVFPGGKVDAEDAVAAGCDEEEVIARHTAAREVMEETGLTVSPESLTSFSHWTTPDQMPQRFATWFFIAATTAEAEVRIDQSEIVDYRWLSMNDALDSRANKEIEIAAPAFVTMTKLQSYQSLPALQDHLTAWQVERFRPRIVKLDDGRCALYHGDAGYEAVDMNIDGARHRLVMRESAWQYISD